MAGRLAEAKVAVITGAASGIGRRTVDLFVRGGARSSARTFQDDKGARMAGSWATRRYVRCDVTSEADIKAAITSAVSTWGKIDALYNNAGTGGRRWRRPRT